MTKTSNRSEGELGYSCTVEHLKGLSIKSKMQPTSLTTLEALVIGRLTVAERIILAQRLWESIAAESDHLPLIEVPR